MSDRKRAQGEWTPTAKPIATVHTDLSLGWVLCIFFAVTVAAVGLIWAIDSITDHEPPEFTCEHPDVLVIEDNGTAARCIRQS